ncbi:hypothetical protein [Nonomuraea soli]|uniref:Arc/MetJ-type ribon-helix-helix transcriptional regulator n=1 Tax=Nonomuraea soli TaxID=1032476 RepID=A0A7W0CSE4_9ACTN|nr:hypothetical protein [Nonomuraea soli]MBA2896415.1 Arc/MetJ-type ribon-helix-helix transcriptional regulator [Nonomuraea soli]
MTSQDLAPDAEPEVTTRKPKIAITVTPEVKSYVDQLVQAGSAESASAVFEAAVREYMHTRRRRHTLWQERAAAANPDRVQRMMAHVESQRDQ